MAGVSQWRRPLQSGGLSDAAVREVLNGEHIEERCRQVQHIWRESSWSPAGTLLAFLLQVRGQETTLRWAAAGDG